MLERDRVHLALQAWIAGHEGRLGGLHAEPRRVPLPADRVQGCQFEKSNLLLHLVDGALHVGDRLGQFLVGGLERTDVCSHVRGRRTSWFARLRLSRSDHSISLN